jgi:Ca2+-binding RTX toxin-like protein
MRKFTLQAVQFFGGRSIERLELTGDANLTGTGNSFNNSLTGNSGDNRLLGGGGVDTLIGGDRDDTLAGQSGNDVMEGGDGNDLLAGSIGNDTYTGGAGIDRLFELAGQGSDTFIFAPGMDRDILYGFESGVDQIDATAFGSASLKTVNGSTIVTFSNTDTLVLVGIDQTDVSDFKDFIF